MKRLSNIIQNGNSFFNDNHLYKYKILSFFWNNCLCLWMIIDFYLKMFFPSKVCVKFRSIFCGYFFIFFCELFISCLLCFFSLKLSIEGKKVLWIILCKKPCDVFPSKLRCDEQFYMRLNQWNIRCKKSASDCDFVKFIN